MDKENKKQIVKNFQLFEQDTGSIPVQIALITKHIENLTSHLKKNKKDFACKKSLLKSVSRRRKYLQYLKHKDLTQYRSVTSKLSLKT